MDTIAAGKTGRAKGLSLYSCPIEIPGTNQELRSNRFSLDSDAITPDLSPDDHPDSPLRTIATQTPTEHFTFHYPDVGDGNSGQGSQLTPETSSGDKPARKRNTSLYGKHSFRTAGERSWFPFSDWIPGTPQIFNRGSKLNRSLVIRDRNKSFSMQSDTDGVTILGQELRSIADDLEVRTRSRTSLNQSLKDD